MDSSQRAWLRNDRQARLRARAIERAERARFCHQKPCRSEPGQTDRVEQAKLRQRLVARIRRHRLTHILRFQGSVNVVGTLFLSLKRSSMPSANTPQLPSQCVPSQRLPPPSKKLHLPTFRYHPKNSKNLRTPKKPFRLLDLPREVRNRIYTFALGGGSPSGKERLPTHTISIRRDCFFNPRCTRSLVVVNRQIYEEALPLLYNSKIFKFMDVECVWGWLGLRSARAREAVQHIQLMLGIETTGFAPSLARRRRGRTLEISPQQTLHDTCRYLADNLTLKTLRISFTGPASMVCSSFHQTKWARSLYQITGLERLTIFAEKENVTVDQESVTFMKAKMERREGLVDEGV